MQISKDMYRRWQEDPVTQAFLEVVMEVANIEVKWLTQDAGLNSLTDRYRAGHIKGLTELVEWEPDYVEGTDDIESQGA